MDENGDTYTPAYVLLSLSAFAITGNLTVIVMVSTLSVFSTLSVVTIYQWLLFVSFQYFVSNHNYVSG